MTSNENPPPAREPASGHFHLPSQTREFGGPTFRTAAALSAAVLLAFQSNAALSAAPLALGDRRELLLDDYLFEKRSGLELRLHSPVPKEIVFTYDSPWDGSTSGYPTIFRDGEIIRMYYMSVDVIAKDALSVVPKPGYACYAESRDGKTWVRPSLGVVEFEGSRQNNIVWTGPKLDNFTPFRDSNPACPADERYKAVAAGPGGLLAFKSSDGIHWSSLVEGPIIKKGKFDTQNNAFWDPLRRLYWCYIRDFHFPEGKPTTQPAKPKEPRRVTGFSDTVTTATAGIRDVRVSTSRDFRVWTAPTILEYPGSFDEPLYTNQIQPYYRAPHIFLGFPSRYIERVFTEALLAEMPDPIHRQRRMSLSMRYGTAITDGLFMSSRDGLSFQRWDEAFLRPGPERRDNWVYGDGFQGLGMIETPAEDPTAPPELSVYVGEDHWKTPRLRRYVLRIDGFVSLHAGRRIGEAVTRPLIFAGKALSLNYSTSAAGTIRVKLQSEQGTPLPGFELERCDELFGDTLGRNVRWKGNADVGALAGRTVRLRILAADADIYSLKFNR